MLAKIPQVGAEITFLDFLAGYRSIFINQQNNFSKALSGYLSKSEIYLVNSGTTAFYLILKVLREFSSKLEVILPSYTAPAMVLPIKKLGLKPVLCDISLKDFNMDLELLPNVINNNTLCIVPTHMFGIPVSGIEKIKEIATNVYIVEDCAQSMGSKVYGQNTGSFCDIGFLSFNRGKNLPTYGGGCIFTNLHNLSEKIKFEVEKLEEQGLFFKFILPFKILAFSLAVRPLVYGILYPAISSFKDNHITEDFSLAKYTNFQAGAGVSLLKKVEEFSSRRYQNGMELINGLSNLKDVILPDLSKNTKPAFNRLPILIKDLEKRDKIKKSLWKSGIDTSYMYLKPVHHIFDLGYKESDFSNATYFAEHLLTLPTHPLLTQKYLQRTIETFRRIFK